MTTSTLQIRVDSDLKRDADKFFSSAGLDISSAVRLFLRQSVLRQRLPFEVVAVNPDPFFSEANQRILGESIRSYEHDEAKHQHASSARPTTNNVMSVRKDVPR